VAAAVAVTGIVAPDWLRRLVRSLRG
jgi:hypothetical protein